MKRATAGQRFVAFLIDAIICGILSFAISRGIFSAANVEEPEFKGDYTQELVNPVTGFINKELNIKLDDASVDEIAMYLSLLDENEFLDYCNDNYSSVSQTKLKVFYESSVDYFDDYIDYYRNSTLITLAIGLVLFTVYYCIIAYYWKKQTIGRFAMHIMVIDNYQNKPTFGKLLLRDLVGFYLVNLLNICCLAPLIMNAIFICGKDKASIGDKLSNTLMVCYDSNGIINEETEVNYNDVINHSLFDQDNSSDDDIKIKTNSSQGEEDNKNDE